jgi:hypothetical protein
MLSRPTASALSGKQTVVLKTMVSDEVADAFTRFAKERGYATVSDCMRELLLVAVYGPDYLTDLHRQRIASLVRNQANAGTGEER